MTNDFCIETDRLILIWLSAKHLKLLAENVSLLENQLNVTYKAEALDDFFKSILLTQYNKIIKDIDQTVWLTFALIVRKDDRVVVGSADYKNIPQDGCVEIGYGLGKQHEHNGYMTETVNAMVKYAFTQSQVTKVTAITDNDNTASKRVLTRCGFSNNLVNAEQTFWEICK